MSESYLLYSPCRTSVAEIFPQYGGTVNAIALNGRSGSENLLFSDSEDEVSSNPEFRGRILFPYNDRIPSGKYTWKDKEYSFDLNEPIMGDSIHGTLYKERMEIVSFGNGKDENSVTLSFSPAEKSPSYPFLYKIQLHYSISKTEFEIEAVIENIGEEEMPFSIGWHPYFTADRTDKADKLSLQINSELCAEVNERLLPSGKMLNPSKLDMDFTNLREIGSREIDLGYKDVTWPVVLKGDNKEIEISGDNELFKYLQVFIPKDRKSVAVEPVSALTNSFNQPDMGLTVLQPREMKRGWMKVISR